MALIQQTQLMDNQQKKFASEEMRNFLPFRRGRFAKLRNISKDKINARGWYYMFQSMAPRNFTQSPFATSGGGIFKDAGGVGYLVQNVVVITHRARLSYDDQTKIVNTSGRQEVSHNVIDQKDKQHLQAMETAMARQFWQDRTNELARVSAINTTTRVITCADAGNLFGVYLIEEGDRLEIFSSGGTQRVGTQNYVIVEAVYPETKAFKYRATDLEGNAITPPASIAATDRIYPEGGKDNGINGVEYMYANSGAFQGQADRTINKQTTGMRMSAGSNALSVAFLRKMTGEVRYAANTENPKSNWNFWVSTQKDAFASLGDALQATQQDGSMLMLGRTGYKFENIEFKWDPYVKRDAVALMDENVIDKGVLKDYAPVGSAPVMKQVNGDLYDFWSIPYSGYWNLGCETPRQLGVYMGELTTAGYAAGHGV